MAFKFDNKKSHSALKAIQELISCNTKSNVICDDVDDIYVTFEMKKVTNPKKISKFITLPNNVFDSSSEVAIVKNNNYSPSTVLKKDGLESEQLKNIIKELTISEFKKEYSDFEAKHQFSQTFDLFVVDRSIHTYVMPLLNKHFLGTTKHPHFINFKKNSAKAYNNIFKQALVKIRSGSCFSVLIGNNEMDNELLEGNLDYLVDNISPFIPGGEDNIRTIKLSSRNAPSLPIYYSSGNISDVVITKIKKIPRVIDAEDVTTVEGAKVRVLESGKIDIISDGTGLFEKTFESESRQPMSNRARKRALELQLIKHKEDALRKYNATLDEEEEQDGRQLPNDMTVDNGDDDEDEEEDEENQSDDNKQDDSDEEEEDEEVAPPAKKIKVEVKEDVKTPKKGSKQNNKTKTPAKVNNVEQKTAITPKKSPKNNSVTPKQTPKNNSVTPKQTPKNNSVTPKQTPKNNSVTPKQTPKKNSVTLKQTPKKKNSLTPKVETATPNKVSTTPKVEKSTSNKAITPKVNKSLNSVKKSRKSLSVEELKKPSPKMLRSRTKQLSATVNEKSKFSPKMLRNKK